MVSICVFFFFQAEDGIRDGHVTGVQTCALPIYIRNSSGRIFWAWRNKSCSTVAWCSVSWFIASAPASEPPLRSEERRVGKECRARWAAQGYKKSGNGKTGRLAAQEVTDR